MLLFVTYSGAFGGAERLLVDFVDGLQDESAIACPPGPLADAARGRGMRVFGLRARPLQRRGSAAQQGRALAHLVAHGLELRQLLDALAPELTVAWGMRSALAAALGARRGTPLALQHNDFLPPGPGALLVRQACRRMRLITALSHAVLAELDPHGRLAGRAQVIFPGVALERFAASDLPAQPPEVLLLGAIVGWKRPDLALETVARARRSVPELRLRVVGAPLPGDDDGLAADLRARAQQPDLAGAVEFAGALPDAAAALARASCLLHCSEREPFGIAVVEALAAGRPAIVPDSAGPAEIVDRECGVRYPPGDAQAAAEAIVTVLGQPELARKMGAAGRGRATACFALADQRRSYQRALAPLRRGPALPRSRPAGLLALLTVTHNSAGEVDALLRSVAHHLPGVRVMVADCASSDDTVARARRHPATEVLELENIGFGRACNRALAGVSEPVTALINPDVELIDDSLLTLAEQALSRESERLLAPLVLNGDGTRQDTVHPAPLSAADLVRALVPPAALPGGLGVPLAPWRARRPRRVGWAVGCAIVARSDTLRSLGPFEERIFLYGEDMELGIRAARRGVETWFCPEARLIHHGGHSIEPAHGGEAFELRAQARHDALRLALGPGRATLDDAAQALTFASRATLKRALGRSAARERAQLRALALVRRAGVA